MADSPARSTGIDPAGSAPGEPAPAAGAPKAATAAGPRRPLLQRILAYRTLIVVGLIVLALDQLTKSWIAGRLAYRTFYENQGAIPVIPGFFTLVHVGNTGAAWSMFSGHGEVLALLAAATLVGIFLWRHSLGLRDRTTQVCFGLLCGGIAGNLIDRLHYGHVVDFIDLYFGKWDYHYPTFNVADSGICVGVILYLWHGLREK